MDSEEVNRNKQNVKIHTYCLVAYTFHHLFKDKHSGLPWQGLICYHISEFSQIIFYHDLFLKNTYVCIDPKGLNLKAAATQTHHLLVWDSLKVSLSQER